MHSVILHCYNTQLFFTAKRCSVIPRCYSTQLFSTARSTIPHVKGVQSSILATVIIYFPLQKVFSHSSMLQCSVIFHYYSVSHFTLLQHTGLLSHFAKLLSSIVGGRWLTARSRACGTEPRARVCLVWSR
jgi:hypothetical protein